MVSASSGHGVAEAFVGVSACLGTTSAISLFFLPGQAPVNIQRSEDPGQMAVQAKVVQAAGRNPRTASDYPCQAPSGDSAVEVCADLEAACVGS